MATIQQQRGGRVEGAEERRGKFTGSENLPEATVTTETEAERGRELQEMYIICASYSHIRGLEPPGTTALHHTEVFSSRRWRNPNLKAKKGTPFAHTPKCPSDSVIINGRNKWK